MADPLFDTAGALREQYAAIDWSATSLGTPDTWSPTMRLTVALMFETRFAVTLFWGPERVLLYNDAYTALIGDKHPAALARPAAEIFPEAWDQLGPLMDTSLAGKAVYLEDAPVPLVRQGFLEECYFTFCYSPVRNRAGEVEGVIDIATETTERVISQRRIEVLGRLSALLTSLDTVEDVLTESTLLLRGATDDLAAVDLRNAAVAVEPDPRLPAEPRSDLSERDLLLDLHDGRPVVWLPLRHALAEPSDDDPALVVESSPVLLLDEDYLTFLRLVARNIAQALDRVEALATERRAAAAERELSEALQRSLLGAPAVGPGLEVAVRYQAAEHLAQIGGDWHDAFVMDDGTTALVVGDIAGHDQGAAVAMAQVKNLLRGTAYGVGRDPGQVLAAVDRAMQSLEVDALATAVLAYVEDPDDSGPDRRLRWSNAGHPPPLLLTADGEARLLVVDGEPELMLGVGPGADRTSSVADLPAGATVVLFTDGLVERRGASIDDGLGWITDTLRGRQDLDPGALCDLLLAEALPGVEDDVALVAVRVTG